MAQDQILGIDHGAGGDDFVIVSDDGRGGEILHAEHILAVEIFNDADESAATPEGIRVGSASDAVTAAYGEASESSDSRIVYLRADGKVKLQFLMRDGSVTNIQYLKADAN